MPFDVYGERRERSLGDSCLSSQQQALVAAQGSQLQQSQAPYRMNKQEKERRRQIENENNILLSKMIQILKVSTAKARLL